MIHARFRPCIDLHGGKVKQIVGASLTDDGSSLKTNFVASHEPAWYAARYRADNLTGGHVIMLGPGNEDAALNALAAWPGGLQLGGGINTSNARKWLDSGAAQLIVTSFIFSGGELHRENLEAIFKMCGRRRLVLDLSCRKRDGAYWIVTDRWQKFTGMKLDGDTLHMLSDYCCEFLIHAVDVEGMQSGIDRELLTLLAEKSPIKCVYAGGISSFADIELIEKCGAGRIDYTVGSALDLFGGSMSYGILAGRNVLNKVRRGR